MLSGTHPTWQHRLLNCPAIPGLFLVLSLLLPSLCLSQPQAWSEKVSLDFGGHLRTTGTLTRSQGTSPLPADDHETLQDLTLETRLKGALRLKSGLVLEAHYQGWLETGDQTRQSLQEEEPPSAAPSGIFPVSPDSDRLRLLDLTSTVSRHADTRIVHRLDRLKLSLNRSWGRVSLGRQALTLGNGLIFNPMDLFNPFSPTALLRDYKTGDDTALVQIPLKSGGDMRFFHLPRREPDTRDVSWNRSSTGWAGHFFADGLEIDLLAARHYEDRVLGFGLSGTLGSAAWRFDLTWTDLGHDSGGEDYFSAVANLDRSWVWGGKNWYGLMECFASGVGESGLTDVLSNKDLVERIDRGELFVLGRYYLAGLVRFEAHPLVNLSGTVIANLEDGSWLLQPKMTWNLAQNLDLLLGATLAEGPANSEFGGFELQIGPRAVDVVRPDSVTLWLTAYF
jgi:hypothetical protein